MPLVVSQTAETVQFLHTYFLQSDQWMALEGASVGLIWGLWWAPPCWVEGSASSVTDACGCGSTRARPVLLRSDRRGPRTAPRAARHSGCLQKKRGTEICQKVHQVPDIQALGWRFLSINFFWSSCTGIEDPNFPLTDLFGGRGCFPKGCWT